jgi:hypothetical protein
VDDQRSFDRQRLGLERSAGAVALGSASVTATATEGADVQRRGVVGVRNDGRIVSSTARDSWQAVTRAGAGLREIGGVGNYAIAVGSSLRTLRWDGATWTEIVPTVAGTFQAERLLVSSSGDAWVAAAATSFGSTPGRLFRLSGSSWAEVSTADVGGSAAGFRTWALFGTGPSNVYALRGTERGARVLYRWDGTRWSTTTTLSTGYPNLVQLGSAIAGLAVIAGSAGQILMSRP